MSAHNLSSYKKSGFTLIELLVVISIIGILATLVAANLNSARSRARDVERKSDLKNIQTALRLYYNDKGRYPSSSSNQMVACDPNGGGTVVICTWGTEWNIGSTIYMQTLPKDPMSQDPTSATQNYKYVMGNSSDPSDTDSYTLSACLENQSDTSGIATSDTTWCSTGWMFQVSQQ